MTSQKKHQLPYVWQDLLETMTMERWLKPKTLQTYSGAIAQLLRFVGTDRIPSSIERSDVLEWRRAVARHADNPGGITERSWNSYCRQLHAIYNFGIKSEPRLIECEVSPFSGVQLREPIKPKKTLPENGIFHIREVMEECRRWEVVHQEPSQLYPVWFWRVVIETFYWTGMRLSQLLGIRPEHVNLKRQYIVGAAEHEKNSREHYYPIVDELLPWISMLMSSASLAGVQRDNQLFNVNVWNHRTRKTTMDVDQVEKWFQRLSRLAGYRVSPHRFRHTFATELLASEQGDLLKTQVALNHRDIKSTLDYVSFPRDGVRRYVEQRHTRATHHSYDWLKLTRDIV